MMKKFGFTLAEVLITLSIIGVVAALTTPALVNNIGNAKIGPALSKFNNTFSNAVQLAMESNEFTQFHSNGTALVREIATLSQHMIMVPYNGNQSYTFTDAFGTNSNSITFDADKWQEYEEMNAMVNDDNVENTEGYTEDDLNALAAQLANNAIINRLNNGTIMVITPILNATGISRGVYRGAVAEVLIDIDGDNGNNRAGIDVFGFLLDASGVLVPAGSAAHNFINQNGPHVGAYTEVCHNGVADLQRNFACTGRIADNNWSAKGINMQ